MRTIMRVYAWLFGLSLSLAALALAMVALLSAKHNLKAPIFSFEGPPVTWWLLGLALSGLVSILLAATGVFRWLLPAWALVAFVLLFHGYFVGSYTFAGASGFWSAVGLTAGALLAFVCSFIPRRAAKTGF